MGTNGPIVSVMFSYAWRNDTSSKPKVAAGNKVVNAEPAI